MSNEDSFDKTCVQTEDLPPKTGISPESAFKVPELNCRLKEQSTISENPNSESEIPIKCKELSSFSLKCQKADKNESNVSPYIEPSFSGKPPSDYYFEVLKGGIIVSTVSLSEKPYIIFGRLSSCDVILEHPSVSRYQAVVQYRAIEDSNFSKGFYVYDLKSTHGTFLNKEQLYPKTYYRIHVGHILKFGGSTRMYILQGPTSDQEEESPYTVTELKQKSQLQKNKEMEAIKNSSEERVTNESGSDGGIDWGMSEDAVEDSSVENPFALSTCNEDLYLDDPKKTLRGWFEREGYELEYNVEEKGFGHFVCRINLPIENPTGQDVIAEASVKGKKKEAVVACALEACRILDRHGVLRQSQHESHKRKQKNWEEDDFYDSDEDVFLDRTGTIEKKREYRKKIMKKESSAETYESLIKRLENIDTEINAVERKLESTKVGVPSEAEQSDADSLDAYMSIIRREDIIDKQTKSILKLQLSKLYKDKQSLQKLIKVACPTSLPVLNRSKHFERKDGRKLPIIGSMKTHSRLKIQLKPNSKVELKNFEEIVEEEEDEEIEKDTKESTDHKDDNKKDLSQNLQNMNQISSLHDSARGHQSSEIKEGKDLTLSSKIQESKPPKKDLEKGKKSENKWKYDDDDPDYSMWVPPENQSGDGHTHLNKKFGY